MEAAVKLAAGKGFSGTRVSDIVGAVGVGQGVFYWYFESKDSLFYEILADSRRRLRHFQGGLVLPEPDPVRRVARGILASIEFIAYNRHVIAVLDHAARQGFQGQQPQRQLVRVHTLDTARHVEEAIASGVVRDGDPELYAQAITAVVNQVIRSALRSRGRPEIDRVAQVAIDFCLGGLLDTRHIDVEDLRRDMQLTPQLIDIRDRVGALAPASDGAVARQAVDGAQLPGRRNGRTRRQAADTAPDAAGG